MNKAKENYYLKITSQKRWFDLNIKEILNYKDLLILFVKRDITTFYKQTILGPLWFFIQPLITTIVFSFIFNKVAKISTGQIPPFLFYMSGVIAWNYFSECLLSTTTTFTSNSYIFGKVYFPRLIIPFSKIVSNLVKLLVQLSLFFCFFIYFYFENNSIISISKSIIFIPFIIFHMGLLGLSIGMIISSLTTKYRDLRFLVSFSIQLLMYATPIAYPLSAIPEKYNYIILYNPMTPIIMGFRNSLLGTGYFDPNLYFYSVLSLVVLFLIGIVLFNRVEKTFIDTV
ncbi:ABC transporter permease [Candidatus Marinimicrobia bacterium]|nr:ABC transporter permease [Candidatus Neomarinimicrobiota bacterium]